MEFDKLLAQSVAQDKAEPKNERPDWVSADNASLDAYNAINSIKTEKYDYISKNKTATKFRVAKTFQVQKSEVEDNIAVSTQALFYTSSYSEKLLKYLHGVNDKLMQRKVERIAKPRTGLAAKSRPEINATAKTALERIQELEGQNAADQLALAIEKLPLNVRRELKLI